MKTAFKSVVNSLAPEVKIQKSFDLNASAKDLAAKLDEMSQQLGLSTKNSDGTQIVYQFKGQSYSDLASVQVLFGKAANPDHYQKLYSLLTLTKLESKLVVKSHERLILGTQSEQNAYKQLLKKRMFQVEEFLKKESVVLAN